MNDSAFARATLYTAIQASPLGLEVNSNFIRKHCFSDILLDDWCAIVGVSYSYNRQPLKEFGCDVTIIFKPKPKIDLIEPESDDEL